MKAKHGRLKPADYDPGERVESGETEDDEGEAGDPNRSLSMDHRSRNGFLAEDGDVDSDDPNLSALFADTGVEERLDELGL
jgi:hypothetical protein